MNRWSDAQTVAGFVRATPNENLLRFAGQERARTNRGLALDIGCGAARNSLPLAKAGWSVIGTDTSRPMLEAAAARVAADGAEAGVQFVHAAMDALPVPDGSVDLIVAHGVWNLARSDAEFRHAVREAARAARPGAGLFLFTFSRHTLPEEAPPVRGQRFVFTQFAGEPQVFLTADEIHEELQGAGFEPDPGWPLRELNRPAGLVRTVSGPVIFEGGFRRRLVQR